MPKAKQTETTKAIALLERPSGAKLRRDRAVGRVPGLQMITSACNQFLSQNRILSSRRGRSER